MTKIFFLILLTTTKIWSLEVKQASSLEPFVTNGCSLPNELYKKKYDDCCVNHDYAYWLGGPLKDRVKADADLISCIKNLGSGNINSSIWKIALEQFGLSRWGAGWNPRRSHTPFDKSEIKKIKVYEQALLGKLPKVTKLSVKIDCSMIVVNTLKEITNLKNISDSSTVKCFKVEDKDLIQTVLIFSTECIDGYFTHQISSKDESFRVNPEISFTYQPVYSKTNFHSLGGYGECHNKIKPEHRSQEPRPEVRYPTIGPIRKRTTNAQ